MKRYLLVSGIARSGTTALTDLLNAHPGVVIGQERFFNLVTPERIREMDETLFEPGRFLEPERAETHNTGWRSDERYVSFLRHKFARATVIGDKVPNYFWHAERMFAILPASRML